MMTVDETTLKLTATILVISGALNWLAMVFNTNLVTSVGGSYANYIYIAVGSAGIYLAYLIFQNYQKTGKLEAYRDDGEYIDI